MMVNYSYIAPILLAALLVAGCSSEDTLPELGGDTGEDPVLEERYGALLAEFVYPRGWGGSGVEVQAQFLDARGVAVESALEALEVWMPRRGLEMGDCQLGASERADYNGYEPVSLHLLDVGHIEVESPGGETALPPRRLPDLLSAFYGVVYGSEWSWESELNLVEYYPGAPYRFSAPGSAKAGGFDVVLSAPDPIILMAANGAELRDESSLEVAADEDLELVWDIDGPGAGSVEVFLDLSTGYGPDQNRIQCRVEDDGAYTIPGSLIRELGEDRSGLELELRRVRRSNATVDGLDEAHFYFVTTDRLEILF